jgi:hypothetical protein
LESGRWRSTRSDPAGAVPRGIVAVFAWKTNSLRFKWGVFTSDLNQPSLFSLSTLTWRQGVAEEFEVDSNFPIVQTVGGVDAKADWPHSPF